MPIKHQTDDDKSLRVAETVTTGDRSAERVEKFTPGPWEWSGPYYGDGGGQFWRLQNADGAVVIDGEGCLGAVDLDDAHLIAAAPDLYAALKELSAIVEAQEWGSTWAGRPHAQADAALAALAKAKAVQS